MDLLKCFPTFVSDRLRLLFKWRFLSLVEAFLDGALEALRQQKLKTSSIYIFITIHVLFWSNALTQLSIYKKFVITDNQVENESTEKTSLPSEHLSENYSNALDWIIISWKFQKSDELLSTVVYETLEIKTIFRINYRPISILLLYLASDGKKKWKCDYAHTGSAIWLTLTVSAQLDEQKKLWIFRRKAQYPWFNATEFSTWLTIVRVSQSLDSRLGAKRCKNIQQHFPHRNHKSFSRKKRSTPCAQCFQPTFIIVSIELRISEIDAALNRSNVIRNALSNKQRVNFPEYAALIKEDDSLHSLTLSRGR